MKKVFHFFTRKWYPSQLYVRYSKSFDLQQEMKNFETMSDFRINPSQPLIVRLDGCNFGRFTKPFVKPFDKNISNAIVNACIDILENKFGSVSTIYTCSDEVSLIIPKSSDVIYSGRIQKICSVLASFLSVKFLQHLTKLCTAEKQMYIERKSWDQIQKNLEEGVLFDARVFNLPSDEHVVDYILWRSKHDCVRNSKTLFARKYFDPNKLHGVAADEIIQRVKEKKGIDWNSTPAAFRYGTFIKREQFDKQGYNPKTKENVIVKRTRCKADNFLIEKGSPEVANFLLSKYWNDVEDEFWQNIVK